MVNFKEAAAFLERYAKHFSQFAEFEFNKLTLLNERRHEELSASLAEEQAFIMQTNALEQKRVAMFGDITLDKLSETAPEMYREKIAELSKEIRETILHIKEMNDIAGVTANERLKRIHRYTKNLDIYNDRGTVKSNYAKTDAISERV
jgi:hypothetical protein